MHRAGTSALTRGLAALGVSLGENLMAPVSDNNEKGFFEDLDIYHLNERLLSKAGSAWHKLAPLNEMAMSGPEWSIERREALAILTRKVKDGPFGFKDPRTALLLPFWRCVFEDLQLDARYVIAIRNPLESAASLEARDGIPLTKGLALWAKHMVEAVRHTGGASRVFVAYERLLENPLAELTRIAVALGLPTPEACSAEIAAYRDDFLQRDLRHNRIGPRELGRSGLAPGYVIDLFEMTMQAAVGDPGQLDAAPWRDIVSRLEEAAPLLAYADALDDDRQAVQEHLHAATSALRDAERLLAEAKLDAQTANQDRLDAAQAFADLRIESERVRAESERAQAEWLALAERQRRQHLAELEERQGERADFQARLQISESERHDLLAKSKEQLAALDERQRELADLRARLQISESERHDLLTKSKEQLAAL
ncbi:MAG: hypothetical protein JSS00_08730, partial [Proteobacteria bacterium]|nr:hypothetical protein [Pseudomonadota bacterium]